MRKVPQNVFFCVLIVLTLNVCSMEPISLNVFLEDPQVKEVIEKGLEKVYLTGDSEGTGGPRKITGLSPNKYYKVENWGLSPESTKSEPDSVSFVKADGTLDISLTGIGRLSGGEITGLINNYTYKVKSAEPLTGDVSYNSVNKTIGANSTVTISVTSSSSNTISLSSTNNNVLSTGTWKVVKGSSPYSSFSTETFNSQTITLGAVGTTNDYIFYEETTRAFYFLRVIVEQPGLAITITPYAHPSAQTLTFNPTSASISRANAIAALDGGTYTLSVTMSATIFTGTGADDGWWYGASKVTSGTTLDKTVIDAYNADSANAANKIDFTMGTKHVFTYTGSIGTSNLPYSGDFEIAITD